VDGIAATSAGAMNAAVMASGLLKDGSAGARVALEAFWRRVADAALFSPFQSTPLDAAMHTWNLDWSPSYLFLDMISRVLSPYQVNPAGLNPLRDVLEGHVDLDGLRAARSPKIFVCATNVRSGDIKVFRNAELSVDALLASACLPFLYQAIEIDGEAYWDGGFMGNPPLYPLIQHCACEDIVIVQINPIRHEEVPTDARHILDRANEISFNATLIRELWAMDLINSILHHLAPDGGRQLKAMRIHMIRNESLMAGLGFSSKLNASWDFLVHLRDEGRAAAERWLLGDGLGLGRRTTFDIAAYARSRRKP